MLIYDCKSWTFLIETPSINSKQSLAKEEANAFCTGSLRKQITEDTSVMWETEHHLKLPQPPNSWSSPFNKDLWPELFQAEASQ